MGQLDRTGFSLFPMPPTPPTKRPRARALANDQHRMAVANAANAGSEHTNSDCPTLLPAPLRVRKKRPISGESASTAASTQAGTCTEGSVGLPSPPTTPAPALPWETPSTAFPGLTSVPSDRAPEYTSQEGEDLNAGVYRRLGPASRTPASSKRASCRTSQFLDGDGQVNRKKLSMYLSGVLDTSFKVGVDSTDQTPLPFDFAQRVSSASNEWRASFQPNAFSKGEVGSCQCPPGVVMCQCYSSPEFEHFRRGQGEHKANPSISSTTCFLSVPRARFRSTLVDVEEVDTPSSPPPLMYDSEDSDEFDWSLPNSPTFQGRQMQYQQTPTPMPRQPPTQRRPVPSFSLPFSHGKQIRPRFLVDRSSMPWEQPSPSSTIPTLASISTVSTFTFDFRDDDDETDYDPFDDSSDVSEIRTWEPIQKAKPVLVHCKGPSPQSIKYGLDYRYNTRTAGSYSSNDTFGYATVPVS